MFPVVRVDSRRAEALEPLGTKRKFWYRDDQGRRLLFKAEERGTGEDWAEKIACEMCALLGLPHVHYDLAVEEGKNIPGVICQSCAPQPIVMGLGNQFLQALDPAYPNRKKYKVRQHTVDVVAEVLGHFGPPPPSFRAAMPSGMNNALDVFVGYVMLDTWIANQDRHDENWAALLDGGRVYLAPTFDHGASMARNLTDRERQDRLTSKDANRRIPHFARKARSAFYASAAASRPMTTMEAWAAFAVKAPCAADIWLEQLAKITPAEVEALLLELPPNRMTSIRRQFTLQLLVENQKRLLAGAIQ